jgi:hypothetical protein
MVMLSFYDCAMKITPLALLLLAGIAFGSMAAPARANESSTQTSTERNRDSNAVLAAVPQQPVGGTPSTGGCCCCK